MPKGDSREKKRRKVSKTRKAKSSTSRDGTINANENDSSQRRTLVVDVGGSGIKATLLNDLGKSVSERLRRESPSSGMPGAVMDTIIALANELEPFDLSLIHI